MGKSILVALLLILFVAALSALAEEAKAKPTRFDAAQFRTSHPRIWLDRGPRHGSQAKCAGKTGDDLLALTGTNTMGKALAYAIGGDEKTGKAAVAEALALRGEAGAATIALVYDWCYPALSDADKKAMPER